MNTRLQSIFEITFGLVALFSWQARIAVSQEAKTTIEIHAATDREDAIYKVGETVTFSIEVKSDGKPLNDGTIVCNLSKDGVQPQPPQTVQLKDGKTKLTGKLDEPGFLLLRASIGKTTALASAGFDPLQLKPSMKIPDDFDSFWYCSKSNQRLAQACAVRLGGQTERKSGTIGSVL